MTKIHVVLESLPNFLSIPGLTTRLLLMRSNSRSNKGHLTPSWDEDWSYLANMYEPSLEEELSTLSRYTRLALVALVLGGVVHWEFF